MSDAYKSLAYLTGFGYVGGSDPTFPDFQARLNTNIDFQNITTDNSTYVLTTNNPENPSWNNYVGGLTTHLTRGYKFVANTTYTITFGFIYWTPDSDSHDYPNFSLWTKDNTTGIPPENYDWFKPNLVGQVVNDTLNNGDIVVALSNWSRNLDSYGYVTYEFTIYFTPSVDTDEVLLLKYFGAGSETYPTNCDYYIAFNNFSCSPEPTRVYPSYIDYTNHAKLGFTVDYQNYQAVSDAVIQIKQIQSHNDDLDISNYNISMKSQYLLDELQNYDVKATLLIYFEGWDASDRTNFELTDTDNTTDSKSLADSYSWFNPETGHEVQWDLQRVGVTDTSYITLDIYSDLRSVGDILNTEILKLTSFSSQYEYVTQFPITVTARLSYFGITPQPEEEPIPPEPPTPPTPPPSLDFINIYNQIAHEASESELEIFDSGVTNPYLFRQIDMEKPDLDIPSGEPLPKETDYHFLISGVLSYRIKNTSYHDEEDNPDEIP